MEGQSLEDLAINAINTLILNDTIAQHDWLQVYKRQNLEPEERLMLEVFVDGLLTFKKYVTAKNSELFMETEEWILTEDHDWPFSFDNLCEKFEIEPQYAREQLIKWKERHDKKQHYKRLEVCSENLSKFPSPESKQVIGDSLTDEHIAVLKAAAGIGYGIAPDNDVAFNYVSKTLGMPVQTVTDYFRQIFNHFGVRDICSSLFLALKRKVLNPEELANFNLEDLAKGIDILSPLEIEVLGTFGTLASKKGSSNTKLVSEALGISDFVTYHHIFNIYNKLRLNNTGTFLVASYLLGEKEMPIASTRVSALTKRHVEALAAVGDLEYNGHFIFNHVANRLGVSIKTAKSHMYSAHERLGVHDIFSSVYVALSKGILHPEELANGKLEDLTERLHTLTSRQRSVLKAYGELAIQKGFVGEKDVSEYLNKSIKTIQSYKMRGIYPKLGIHNTAQLAVASYIFTSRGFPTTIERKKIEIKKEITDRDVEILTATADLGYDGSSSFGNVSNRLGISLKTAESHLTRIRGLLGVHDIFSAIYAALYTGIINPESVANGRLNSLVEGLERLTYSEQKVLRAYGDVSLQKGCAREEVIANFLNLSRKTIESHRNRANRGIYFKLGMHNAAQLAVASYILATRHPE